MASHTETLGHDQSGLLHRNSIAQAHCRHYSFVRIHVVSRDHFSIQSHGSALKAQLSFHRWKTVSGTSKLIFPNFSLTHANLSYFVFIIYFLLMSHLIISLGEQNSPAVEDLHNAERTNDVIFFFLRDPHFRCR